MATLRGKVALVTGAGRGIGRAIAVELGRTGVSVGLLSRTLGDLEETRELVEAAGAAAIVAPADLADAAGCARAVEEVRDAFGPVDVLVNNGAAVGPVGQTPTIDADAYGAALEVNVVAPIRLSVALLPEMRERGFGRILNISTGAVARAPDGEPWNCYIASKAALEAHSVGLAAELAGSGVTLNVLRPGVIDTAMQTYLRNQDPAVVGEAFVGRFRARFEKGDLLSAEVPARVVREMLEGDDNGAIVSTADWLARRA